MSTARLRSIVTAAALTCAMSASATPMGERLGALLEQADQQALALEPQAAVARGDLRRAGEFGDLISDAHFRRAEADLRVQRAQLRTIDRRQLDARERVAYDMFAWQTALALRGYDKGLIAFAQQMPLDPIFGLHLGFAQFSSGSGAAPYRTHADYEAGLSRLDGYVVYLDRAIERLRQGVRARRVHPRWIVQRTIDQLDAALAQPIEDSPYFGPVRQLPAEFAPAERERWTAAYREAIAAHVQPALARVRDHLRREVLPAARTQAPGLSALPGGLRYYAHQLEAHSTVRMSAHAIHRRGLAEVARVRAAIRAVQRRIGFEGPLHAFFEHLRNDARYKHVSREALLASYEDVRVRVEQVLPRYFAALPRSRLEVRPVPAEQEGSAGGAYYMVGTPDGTTRPGVFYVNTGALPTRTTPRTTALFLHEGLPGHHLQASLAQEDTTLPPTLRFAWNAGYGEGWALYCEWIGHEMGLYRDPVQHYGQLDMEMFRAVRLVVDTGLHAKGWSRERAVRYMLDHTSLERSFLEGEVDRYIVWPGQAPAYKLGEMRLRALRDKARRTLGPRFDLRAFHDQVLNTGAVPLAVLDVKIDEWIRSLQR